MRNLAEKAENLKRGKGRPKGEEKKAVNMSISVRVIEAIKARSKAEKRNISTLFETAAIHYYKIKI
jgi:predicted transcriptional regulator